MFGGTIGSGDTHNTRTSLAAALGTRTGAPTISSTILGDAAFAWEAGNTGSVHDGLVFLFDGRIDNCETLAQSLDFSGLAADPATAGNTHYLIAAWRRWGADLARHLLGDFVLAVWEGAARRLILSRDASRSRLLYVGRQGRRTAFATTLPPLLALPGFRWDLDDDAIVDLLAFQTDPAGATVWRGIRMLPSATTLVVTPDGATEECWWSPAEARPVRFRDTGAYLAAGRELFDRAVACRLPASGPVVVSTSGGLDSTAVAATAARLAGPGRVHALHLAAPDGAPLDHRPQSLSDERPLVRALARVVPHLALEILTEAGSDPVECDPTPLFAAIGTPVASIRGVGWHQPAGRRAAALGAGQLLGGDFGDACLSFDGGDAWPSLLLRGAWLRLAQDLRALQGWLPASLWHHLRSRALAPLEPAALRAWRHRRRRQWSQAILVRPELLPGLAQRAAARARPGFAEAIRQGMAGRFAWARAAARFSSEQGLVRRALTGITTTSPFEDRRVWDFCLGLPPEMFILDGRPRGFARRLFADRLPAEIVGNPRKGDQGAEWFHKLTLRRDALAAEAEGLAASPLAGRFIDIAGLRGLIADWPADVAEATRDGRPDYRSILTRALHVGAFLRWVEGGRR